MNEFSIRVDCHCDNVASMYMENEEHPYQPLKSEPYHMNNPENHRLHLISSLIQKFQKLLRSGVSCSKD